MPTTTDLSQYHTLCETYEFLGIDVLSGDRQSTDSLFTDLKAGKSDYALEYKHHYTEIKGDKSKARDAAFKLLYLMLLGEFTGDEVKHGAKVFDAVLFVVSHSGTFGWKARSVVRAAYEERFVVSGKQMARLDQWEKGEGAEREEDDDTTTDDEVEDYYFNSDDSGDWD